MKMRAIVYTIAAVTVAAVALQQAAKSSNDGTGAGLRSELPLEVADRTVLNTTPRHREWVNVPAGSAGVLTFIVYPERSDKAPVVIITSEKQGASDWIRAWAISSQPKALLRPFRTSRAARSQTEWMPCASMRSHCPPRMERL